MDQTGYCYEAMNARHGERFRWLLLLAVTVGTIAALISSTIFNVAIPTMSEHFHLGQSQAQWIMSSFMLATMAGMLMTPWLLNRFGYRHTFIAAVTVLMLGGIAGGFAAEFNLVLAARAVSGYAAGVIQPLPAIFIMRSFATNEQGKANGMFGMWSVLAPALGPSVGGLMIDHFGWRSAFFMILPLCVLSIWMGRKYVPTNAPNGPSANSATQALDWTGLTIAMVGTFGMINGLVALHHEGWESAWLLLIAAASLPAFILWELRMSAKGRKPLMEMRLFGSKAFAAGCAVNFIYGIALFGSTYLLPVFMQLGLSFSASVVGTPMLPAGLILGAVLALAGRMADRTPAHLMVIAGLAVMALAFAFTSMQRPGASLSTLIVLTVLSRIGLGVMMPSLTLGSMRPLEKKLIPQGSSAFSFLRILGGTIGISLCGIVFDWRSTTYHSASAILNNVSAFRDTYWMLASLCVLAAIAALQLRPGASKQQAVIQQVQMQR